MARRARRLAGAQVPVVPSPTPYDIVWLSAAAIDRRRIVRYIVEKSREPRVAVAFMDALMGKIDLLAHDTVQFKQGRLVLVNMWCIPITSLCTVSMKPLGRYRSSGCGVSGINRVRL